MKDTQGARTKRTTCDVIGCVNGAMRMKNWNWKYFIQIWVLVLLLLLLLHFVIRDGRVFIYVKEFTVCLLHLSNTFKFLWSLFKYNFVNHCLFLYIPKFIQWINCKFCQLFSNKGSVFNLYDRDEVRYWNIMGL